MLLRRRTRMVAILTVALIMSERAIAFGQTEVAPSVPDEMEEARKKKVRDTETNTTDCVGSCSGSVSCCP